MRSCLFSILLLCLIATGCKESVVTDPVHGRLIGYWTLNVDCYVVKYDDEFSRLLMVPCLPEFDLHLPARRWQYDERSIGLAGDGKVIVGAIRRGSAFEIVDVLRDDHPTMGVSYHPIVKPMAGVMETKKLDGVLLYEGFEQGVLNPAWAKPN